MWLGQQPPLSFSHQVRGPVAKIGCGSQDGGDVPGAERLGADSNFLREDREESWRGSAEGGTGMGQGNQLLQGKSRGVSGTGLVAGFSLRGGEGRGGACAEKFAGLSTARCSTSLMRPSAGCLAREKLRTSRTRAAGENWASLRMTSACKETKISAATSSLQKGTKGVRHGDGRAARRPGHTKRM